LSWSSKFDALPPFFRSLTIVEMSVALTSRVTRSELALRDVREVLISMLTTTLATTTMVMRISSDAKTALQNYFIDLIVATMAQPTTTTAATAVDCRFVPL
jgi:hypothetical protein